MPKQQNLFVIFLFLLIVALPFIIEFKQNKFSQSKENTIEFWQYWSGKEKKPLEDLVKKFNSENHGFKVKMLSISMPRKKILMAVAGGVAPDLIHLDGDMVTDFGLRGALTPLNQYFNQEYFDHFISVYINMLNIQTTSPLTKPSDARLASSEELELTESSMKIPRSERNAADEALGAGLQYALPLMPTCEAMHLNKKLLDKYSLPIPKTLDDIVNAFDLINKQTNNSFKEIAWLPSWPPWTGSFIVSVFGGNWHKANSAENIAAWTWVQENFARKIPADKLAAFTEGFHAYQSPDNPFYVGRIAIENNGVWEKNLAKIFAPKLNVVVAKFPVFAKASTGKPLTASTTVTVDAIAIPRGAKHPEQAVEFIKWLTKQENLEYLALEQKKFTPLKSHSEEFFAHHENPYIKVFIDLANSPNAVYFPQVPYVSRYKREIKEAYNRVLRLEQSPEEALNELEKKFKGI